MARANAHGTSGSSVAVRGIAAGGVVEKTASEDASDLNKFMDPATANSKKPGGPRGNLGALVPLGGPAWGRRLRDTTPPGGGRSLFCLNLAMNFFV
jgi:hypothetical protein